MSANSWDTLYIRARRSENKCTHSSPSPCFPFFFSLPAAAYRFLFGAHVANRSRRPRRRELMTSRHPELVIHRHLLDFPGHGFRRLTLSYFNPRRDMSAFRKHFQAKLQFFREHFLLVDVVVRKGPSSGRCLSEIWITAAWYVMLSNLFSKNLSLSLSLSLFLDVCLATDSTCAFCVYLSAHRISQSIDRGMRIAE